MNGETLRLKVVITNPQGLHMRPITTFTQRAGQFQSSVWIWKGEQKVNGKSPLELMFLGAEPGAELILEVSGPDEVTALAALAAVLAAPSPDELPEASAPSKG